MRVAVGSVPARVHPRAPDEGERRSLPAGVAAGGRLGRRDGGGTAGGAGLTLTSTASATALYSAISSHSAWANYSYNFDYTGWKTTYMTTTAAKSHTESYFGSSTRCPIGFEVQSIYSDCSNYPNRRLYLKHLRTHFDSLY